MRTPIVATLAALVPALFVAGFAGQLVDVERGVVIGNQVTPIPVELDSESHTIDVDLEMMFQSVAAGRTVQFQIVAATALFPAPQLGGSIEFQSIDVELPVVTSLAP